MSDKNKENLICRACLKRIENWKPSISIHSYAKTLLFENLLIKDMIEKCIPEMDVEICDNTVICTDCCDLLLSSYTFRSKCLDTEEKIYFFIEKKNLKLGNKLDLNCVLEEGETCERYADENIQGNKEVVLLNTKDVTNNVYGSENEDVNIVDTDNDTVKSQELYSKALKKRHPRRGYACGKCEYKAQRKDLLKKHEMDKCINRIASNRYKCDLCSYSTIRKRHLIRHKFTHGGKRPFVCGLCDKGFTEKNNIKNHMLMHAGYKFQYKSKEECCKPTYTQTLSTHGKYRKPFMCKLCNKALPDQSQWNLHMEKIHDLCFL